MKIIKIANGKSKLKITKKEWEGIGKIAGWAEEIEDSKPLGDFGILKGTLNLKGGATPFSVAWDMVYKDYTIYFPTIIMDENTPDQIIRITDDPDRAKGIFQMVQKRFGNAPQITIEAIYDMLRDYIKTTVANNKTKLKLTKTNWESMGKKAGWMKLAESPEDLLAILDAQWIDKNSNDYLELKSRIENGEFNSKFHLINSIKKRQKPPAIDYNEVARTITKYLVDNGFAKPLLDTEVNAWGSKREDLAAGLKQGVSTGAFSDKMSDWYWSNKIDSQWN